MLKIARMLRRWLPLQQPASGSRVEELIAQLEVRAIVLLQIERRRSGTLDTSSRLDQLVAHPLCSSAVVTTQRNGRRGEFVEMLNCILCLKAWD